MATISVSSARSAPLVSGRRLAELRAKLPVLLLFLPPALLLFTVFVVLPMGEAAW
jgi:raffinose/stachyose/melibiose transport system permease protein